MNKKDRIYKNNQRLSHDLGECDIIFADIKYK